MKFLMLFVFIVLLITPSFADRIMITKTSKKSNLRSIQKKLTQLRVKMYVYKSKNTYIVYSQEFSNQQQAYPTLSKIKTYFPSAYIKKRQQTAPVSSKIENNSQTNFFINLSYSYSSIQINDSTEATINDSGKSYGAKVGYYFTDNFYISLAYLQTNIEDLSLVTYYSSLDYQYNFDKDLSLYAGILVGYGQLDLDVANATPSTSSVGGVEGGISYEIIQNIPISLSYQGLYLGHQIVYSSTKTLDFTLLHNVSVSIGYKF